jgi:hypothetical protein
MTAITATSIKPAVQAPKREEVPEKVKEKESKQSEDKLVAAKTEDAETRSDPAPDVAKGVVA